MAPATAYKQLCSLMLFLHLFVLMLPPAAFAQTKQSYRNHEEIEIGGGMKVEILKCYGEGPTEECDCIYFTDKRQNGTRMKQNANRIKEEERAYNLAKGISKPDTRNTAIPDDYRPDKAIPLSIVPKPIAKVTPAGPTLAEAVRKADSVAKASSQKMLESASRVSTGVDSVEMDQVFIPKVTESGEARLEPLVKVAGNNPRRDTTVKEPLKDTMATVAAVPVNTSPTQDTATVAIPQKDTVAIGPVRVNSISSDSNNKASKDTFENRPPTVTIAAAPKVLVPVPSAVVIPEIKKDTVIVATISQDSVSFTAATDTTENWVKQYQLKTTPDTAVAVINDAPVIPKTNRDSVELVQPVLPEADRNLIGKSAEVNTKGEWEKVIIVDKETEFLYKVHYRGMSTDRDEWVSVTQIRNIDSTTNTMEKGKAALPATGAKVKGNCSFEAPAPPVSNADRFSEKLAKRKIYEQYVGSNKGNKSKKTGITFLSLIAENPYVNTVSISSAHKLEIKLSYAPAGAMIYPVSAVYTLCEQVAGKTSSTSINANYGCFRNKNGAWTCTMIE
jgi:hypothetical protein